MLSLDPDWGRPAAVHLFRRGANDNAPGLPHRLFAAALAYGRAAIRLVLAAGAAFGLAGIVAGLLASFGWV